MRKSEQAQIDDQVSAIIQTFADNVSTLTGFALLVVAVRGSAAASSKDGQNIIFDSITAISEKDHHLVTAGAESMLRVACRLVTEVDCDCSACTSYKIAIEGALKALDGCASSPDLSVN